MAIGAIRGRLRGARQRLFLWNKRRQVGGRRFAKFGHRSLIVDPYGILAPHRIEIGANVLVHHGAMFSVVESFNGRRHQPRLRIGDRTNIGYGVWLSCVGEIDIGEGVLIGHNVLIADSYHEYHDPEVAIIDQPMAEPRPAKIGSGSIIGPNAAILAGVTLGERSFVTAGAVLGESVPANSVVAGNPARVVRRYDGAQGTWVDA
jgi:acetyltransferase-like isoleucine patch superfamily enzyme